MNMTILNRSCTSLWGWKVNADDRLFNVLGAELHCKSYIFQGYEWCQNINLAPLSVARWHRLLRWLRGDGLYAFSQQRIHRTRTLCGIIFARQSIGFFVRQFAVAG